LASDGSFPGYGGVLWRKRKLPELEERTKVLSLPGL